jgi:hypothetical protein
MLISQTNGIIQTGLHGPIMGVEFFTVPQLKPLETKRTPNGVHSGLTNRIQVRLSFEVYTGILQNGDL